jgi:hypothetical protein
MAVKCGGSVIIGSGLTLLFNCLSISILNPVSVFPMAFTSFTFAVILALISVTAFSFLTFTSFTSLFSVLFSLLKFCLSYRQSFRFLLSLLSLLLFVFSLLRWLKLLLSLPLFEKWFSPGEVFLLSISFPVVVVLKEHIGRDRLCDQSHNWVLLELLRRGLVLFCNFFRWVGVLFENLRHFVSQDFIFVVFPLDFIVE